MLFLGGVVSHSWKGFEKPVKGSRTYLEEGNLRDYYAFLSTFRSVFKFLWWNKNKVIKCTSSLSSDIWRAWKSTLPSSQQQKTGQTENQWFFLGCSEIWGCGVNCNPTIWEMPDLKSHKWSTYLEWELLELQAGKTQMVILMNCWGLSVA